MARIETDPNYTAPTFSRATEATDIFVKTDVQGVAAAMSTHDHASGKGLAVTRLGTLNQDITWGVSDPKLLANNLTIMSATVGGTSLTIRPNGTGYSSGITLYARDPVASVNGSFSAQDSGLLIMAGRTGGAAFGSIHFYTSETSRVIIQTDGLVNISNGISVGAGGITTSGAFNTTGGYIYLAPAGNHLIGSGNQIFYRSVDGSHNFQTTAAQWGNVSCSTVYLSFAQFPNGQYMTNAADCLAVTGNWQINGGTIYFDGGRTIALKHWGAGYLQTSHHFGAAGAGDYGWGINLPPTHASVNYNKGIANAWSVHSSKDFKAAVQPLEDPLALVMNPDLHGVSYSQVNRAAVEGEEALLEPNIGFVADDWLPHVPEIVSTNNEGRAIAMDYARVGAITWEGLKQLTSQVGALEGRIAALEGASTT